MILILDISSEFQFVYFENFTYVYNFVFKNMLLHFFVCHFCYSICIHYVLRFDMFFGGVIILNLVVLWMETDFAPQVQS